MENDDKIYKQHSCPHKYYKKISVSPINKLCKNNNVKTSRYFHNNKLQDRDTNVNKYYVMKNNKKLSSKSFTILKQISHQLIRLEDKINNIIDYRNFSKNNQYSKLSYINSKHLKNSQSKQNRNHQKNYQYYHFKQYQHHKCFGPNNHQKKISIPQQRINFQKQGSLLKTLKKQPKISELHVFNRFQRFHMNEIKFDTKSKKYQSNHQDCKKLQIINEENLQSKFSKCTAQNYQNKLLENLQKVKNQQKDNKNQRVQLKQMKEYLNIPICSHKNTPKSSPRLLTLSNISSQPSIVANIPKIIKEIPKPYQYPTVTLQELIQSEKSDNHLQIKYKEIKSMRF